MPRSHRGISSFASLSAGDHVPDAFPPPTKRTKRPRHPVAFYTQKNHKLLDSRFLSGGMLLQRAFIFFFFNVLYDLPKVAALPRYYALLFPPFLPPSIRKFKPFEFPDIFP